MKYKPLTFRGVSRMNDTADTFSVRLKPVNWEEAMQTSQRIRALHRHPAGQRNQFSLQSPEVLWLLYEDVLEKLTFLHHCLNLMDFLEHATSDWRKSHSHRSQALYQAEGRKRMRIWIFSDSSLNETTEWAAVPLQWIHSCWVGKRKEPWCRLSLLGHRICHWGWFSQDFLHLGWPETRQPPRSSCHQWNTLQRGFRTC